MGRSLWVVVKVVVVKVVVVKVVVVTAVVKNVVKIVVLVVGVAPILPRAGWELQEQPSAKATTARAKGLPSGGWGDGAFFRTTKRRPKSFLAKPFSADKQR